MALTDGLVSWWKLDETSDGSGAVTRVDSHGTNHLTDNNTTASAAGKINNGASFVAANDEWLSVADNATLQVGALDWMFSAWIFANSTAADRGVMGRRTGNNSDSTFDLYCPATTRLTLITTSGITSTSISSTVGSIAASTWHFVVIGWDETAKKSSLQIGAGTAVLSAAIGTPNAGTLPLEIGRRTGSTSFDWDGLIDEVGFWKRKLTAEEITALYNSGDGLAYPFGEGGAPRSAFSNAIRIGI